MEEAYLTQGNYNQALFYFGRAMAIRERILGGEHPDVGESYNNIGAAYQFKGDLEQALKYCRKALEIRETVLGREHIETGETYGNIGFVYGLAGNFHYPDRRAGAAHHGLRQKCDYLITETCWAGWLASCSAR